MPATTKKIPVEFNVYWPTGTNNPYIKDAVNYSNQTFSRTAISGITDGPDADGDDLSNLIIRHTNIYYQSHTAVDDDIDGLNYSTETKVFSKKFTAATGYHYTAIDNSHVLKRVLERYPKHAKAKSDQPLKPVVGLDKNYANRWKFIETLTKDPTTKLVTAVQVDGYYTTPDYRSRDALKLDGTVITKALENPLAAMSKTK